MKTKMVLYPELLQYVFFRFNSDPPSSVSRFNSDAECLQWRVFYR